MKIKTLAGGLIAAGLAFGLAACGSASPPTSAATTAPAPPPVTIQAQMVAWWATAKTPFTAMENDLTQASADTDRSDLTALAADCAQLVTDIQTLQAGPAAPAPTVNTPLQAGLTAYAKAGAECETGATTGDVSQIDASSADLTVGGSEIAQTTSALDSLGTA